MGNVLLGGKQQIDAKNSDFEIFESVLDMKSVSMTLNTDLCNLNWAGGLFIGFEYK